MDDAKYLIPRFPPRSLGFSRYISYTAWFRFPHVDVSKALVAADEPATATIYEPPFMSHHL
jgi:hypothetical protein